MGTWSDANELAVLSAGADPEWVLQETFTGRPVSVSSGVAMTGALKALVAVALREDVTKRTARVTITTLDLSASDYTVTIDGTAVTYDADSDVPAAADAEDVLQGIADAINADATANLVVLATATDTDDDEVLDTVVITGKTEVDYSIDVSATGSGVLACVADPITAVLRVFTRADGTGGAANKPAMWLLSRGASDLEIDINGFMERLEVAGLARIYVELTEVEGHASDGGTVTYAPTVHIGPGIIT